MRLQNARSGKGEVEAASAGWCFNTLHSRAFPFLLSQHPPQLVLQKPFSNAVQLQPGGFLVQNEANTDVGKAVIQLAKASGIKTINIIVDKQKSPETIDELKNLGGDIVVTESYTKTWYMKRLFSDVPSPTTGLNFSDGSLATVVAKLLGKGGNLVTSSKKLPQDVVYQGARRYPIAWSHFLETRILRTQFL